jgi:hypothetical protein
MTTLIGQSIVFESLCAVAAQSSNPSCGISDNAQ